MTERKPTVNPTLRSVAASGVSSEVAATMSQANASIDTSQIGVPRSAMPNAPETPVPTQFGRYRIEKELGKGAMGVVYLAEDTTIGRKVALKIPKKSILEEPDALERFYREAKTTGQIRHPNICPVYDVGAIDGTHYLTMAYIPGKPVNSFLGKGKLPAAKQVALLIRKIALALDEAHKQGVIHRDLKPSNVMLDDRGEPIVMDFGLACNTNTAENARLTQSGAILGTPAYMAPEQVRGELNQIGPCSDIYALGVMMYQFLTGELPYNGPIMMVFAQIIGAEPKRPADVRPDVDPTLAAICQKMMAKTQADRYVSMKDVAAALTAYLKTGTTSKVEITESVTPMPVPAALPEPDFENQQTFPKVPLEVPAKSSRKKAGKTSGRAMPPGQLLLMTGLPGGLAAFVLFAVFYVQWGSATVRIEINDPSFKVRFGKQELTIENDGAPITVKPGKQELLVIRDGLETTSKEFTLKSGETKKVSVALVEGKVELIIGDVRENSSLPSEPPKETIASSSPKGAKAPATFPVGPLASPIKWLGYSVHDPKVIPEIADYTNLICDRSWSIHGDVLAQEARQRGLRVLATMERWNFVEKQQKLFDYIERNRDVVAGVCFLSPYTATEGFREKQQAAFGKLLKEKFPGITYWVSYIEMPAGMQEPLPPVPDEVDVIDVADFFDMSPQAVELKVNRYLPEWLKRAKGRPVVLRWVTKPSPNHKGGPLKAAPGTFEKCAELVEKYKLAGLIFDQYGSHQENWSPGIDTQPAAVKEIRGIAAKYGFESAAKVFPVGAVYKGTRRYYPAGSNKYRDSNDLTWTITKRIGDEFEARYHTVIVDEQSETWTCKGHVILDSSGNATIVGEEFIRIDAGPGNVAQGTSLVAKLEDHGKAFRGTQHLKTGARNEIDTTLSNPEILGANADVPLPPAFQNKLGMKFVLVPKGTAWLGGGGGKFGDREVEFKDDFYIGKYEVTQGEWGKVMGNNPSSFSRTGGSKDAIKDISDEELKQFPADSLSWEDAQKFLEALNAREKETDWIYRLPTENEWEYACRGGPMSDKLSTTFDFYFAKPTNALLPAQANFSSGGSGKGGLGRTCRVGLYESNPIGLCDMHGNVTEWCKDSENAANGTSERVSRGGNWYDDSVHNRAATRWTDPSSSRNNCLGLRLARVRVENKLFSDLRQRWVHETGEFAAIGKGVWEEKSPNGTKYNYQEIIRNDQYVELDPNTGNTNLRVRLYADRCEFAEKPKLNFSQKFTGKWAKVPQAFTTAANAERFGYPINGNEPMQWNFAKSSGHSKGPNRNGVWKIGSVEIDKASRTQFGIVGFGNQLLCEKITDDIYTEQKFGDVRVELEFMIPQGSNSGVFLMGEYGLNICDGDNCGQLLHGPPPYTNSRKPAGEWNAFDITFRAPKFDAAGKKTSNTRFEKVVLNERLLYQDASLKEPTKDPSLLTGKESATGPLMLQGSLGPVAFRNIRITPLESLPSQADK